MGKLLSILLASSLVTLATHGSPATAGTPLTLLVDRSQVIRLEGDPGTIVIGNPAIADVSVNGRQLFINGHSYGETNLMIFDHQDNKIADYDLTVTQSSASGVTMFVGSTANGAKRYSYSCTPNCERTITVGDGDVASVVGDNSAKSSFTTGNSSSLAAAKPAAAAASSSNAAQ